MKIKESNVVMCDELKPSVLLVDPLAGEHGHLLEDDAFLSECLSPLSRDFLVVTSPASVRNLKQTVQVKTREIPPCHHSARFPRMRLLRVLLTMPCHKYDHIVFPAFEEVSTLFFMFLHPRHRVHLIVHNNLRPDRLKRHPILGRFILRLVFKRASSIIVHCQHQIDRIIDLVPELDPAKSFIEPYHKFGSNRARHSWEEKSRKILFLGPERSHKKLDPMVELIKRDTDRRYRYLFCAMGDELAPATRAFLETQPNVDLLFGYLSNDDYYRLISDSALVMLTHDHNFEGTMSGILCDAIASGTPIIARNMAPQSEFFERFGEMGFLVDYTDPKWCENVLDADLAMEYGNFQNSMAAFRAWCGVESSRKLFASILQ